MSILILFVGGLLGGFLLACWLRTSISQGPECWFMNGICGLVFGSICYYSLMISPVVKLLYPVIAVFGFLTLIHIKHIVKDIFFSATKQHIVMEGDTTRDARFWENQ